MPTTQPARNESHSWIGKAFAGGALSALGKHFAVAYLIPLGLPVLTAVLGYLEGFPWMWILTASGLTFGGVSNGLVKFDDWRERRRVAGKLGFAKLLVGLSASGGINIGFVLINRGAAPIEFEFVEARSRLRNSVPPGMLQAKGQLNPRARAEFYLGAIHGIGDTPKPGEIKGSIEAEIKYGRPGTSLKHTLRVHKGVTLTYNEAGKLVAHFGNEIS
jgi:hypothetical protein